MPLPARISKSFTGLLHASLAVLFLTATPAFAQPADKAMYDEGQTVFKQNCASCHKPDGDMTGPWLKGATERWQKSGGDIHAWVKNSSTYMKTSGDSYAKDLFAKWKNVTMTPNAVTDAQIDAALYFVDNYVAPVSAKKVEGPAPTESTSSGWQWLVIIALLFAIVWMSLRGVKNQLRSAVSEAEGHGPVENETWWVGFKKWAWGHKKWATVFGFILFCMFITTAYKWAMTIGVYGGDTVAHYKPSQPIAFNHTLHAGKDNLAINCQYCHSSAEKSKHAGIPSANICMNCHKAIEKGPVTGTTEIAKIYHAVGWDPLKKEYTGVQDPIKWNKVHVLPDHVSFSHATHVAIGKIECQTCHGPVDTKMDVVEQWSPLTMGWCIQCHAQTEVKMAGNGYYDEIHRRLEQTPLGQRELKQIMEDDKITVKELGGWECAKCHY